jgi:predicted dehydrogenase
MADRIRIGMIGVGQIGKSHLKKYAEIPDAEIVAVADINAAEAQRVAELYKIPHVYTDFRQMLQRDDILAVDVCLHNNLHRPATVAAFEAGKHVYCEKPMAGSFVDAQAMMDAARSLGRKFSIQLSTLFSNETKAAKALIDMGKLGKIYHARSTGFRRRGRPFVDGYGSAQFVQKDVAAGGALYDMGVYHIAAMLYLIGNPAPGRISGKVYQEMDMDEARRQSSGYNVEELGLGFVKFSGGLTLDLIEAWAVNLDKFDGSCIFGSQGGLRLEPFGYFFSQGDLDFNAGADLGGFSWRLHSLRANPDAYDSPQQHWVAALQGRVDLLPTAELALNTMLISEGIYLSDRLGHEVSAAEVLSESVSTEVAL